MIRTCDNGHPPARVVSGTPCRECERRRPSRQARGYDAAHQRARALLLTLLPAPCAYGCGAVIVAASDLVAAHVVDGDPSAGWQVSCRSCNERAKRRGWGSTSEGPGGGSTRALAIRSPPGFPRFSGGPVTAGAPRRNRITRSGGGGTGAMAA